MAGFSHMVYGLSIWCGGGGVIGTNGRTHGAGERDKAGETHGAGERDKERKKFLVLVKMGRYG